MSVSVNAQGELKAGSELRVGGESAIGEGKGWWHLRRDTKNKVDIFQMKSMLYESGSSDPLAYSLNSSPGESDELPSFMFEI